MGLAWMTVVRQFKFEKMPFTAEQLFRVFEKYNHAVFPIQILLICAAGRGGCAGAKA
jgi:hypothetical protein